MNSSYDKKYDQEGFYWGIGPSHICYEVLKLLPPDRSRKVLDIGCGEGRNAVFFALNGYAVSGFDMSEKGLEKAKKLADMVPAKLNLFKADVNTYRLAEPYDVLFSIGVLHYIPPPLRSEIMNNYKTFTTPGGLHVFTVFVEKPFVKKAPDSEEAETHWASGELMTYYHDWHIVYCAEEVFECNSGGIPHQHAVNRIIARRPK
jgi:tellurite methyltransferase